MKRLLVAGLLSLLVSQIVFAGVAPAVTAEPAACSEPTAEWTYSDSALVYRLAVDLTGCEWWDGSPVELVATLDRVDGQSGQGAAAFAICGPLAAAPEDANEDEPAVARPRSGHCEVEVDIEHPAAEVAHYHGEITYPWQGGDRTVSFTALCGPAGCVDLPADTTTGALATLSDLYDTLTAGEDDA